MLANNETLRPSMVVHIYNPSYLGGRDQKDHGSRTAQAMGVNKTPSKQISCSSGRAPA
jgi:hypothetical protein